MKALTLINPMGFAVVHLMKRLENRNWSHLKRGIDGLRRLPFGGVEPGERFAIHVSSSNGGRNRKNIRDAYVETCRMASGLRDLPSDGYLSSALIGTARVVDVITPYDTQADVDRIVGKIGREEMADQMAKWWSGPYALVLDDVRPLMDPIREVKGALFFWPMLPAHERAVLDQLGAAA